MRSKKESHSAKDNALAIAKAALDKKADNVVIMKMGKLTAICDFFIICSGNTERKNKAIADNIIDELGELSLKPKRIEGYNEASWIVLDYNSVVVHVFRNDLREFYNLEHLWADAPRNMLTEESVKKVKKRTYKSN